MHTYIQIHRPRETQEWGHPGVKRLHVQNVELEREQSPQSEKGRGARTLTGSTGHAERLVASVSFTMLNRHLS